MVRELEHAGVVRREAAAPPIASTLFHLTPRGEELRPVVHALVRWGAPLMADFSDDHAFRSDWLAVPAEIYLSDHAPDEPPIAIEVRTGEQSLVVEAGNGQIHTRRGPVAEPDAVLSGPPPLVAGVLAGVLDIEKAKRDGLHYEGDPGVLLRVQPGPQ